MQTHFTTAISGHSQAKTGAPQRIALDENELAARWGLSVKTLRRWRSCFLQARRACYLSDLRSRSI